MFATQIGLGLRSHPSVMFPTSGTRYQNKVAGQVMVALETRLRTIDIPGRAFCIWTPGNGALCEFQGYAINSLRAAHELGPPDSVGTPT